MHRSHTSKAITTALRPRGMFISRSLSENNQLREYWDEEKLKTFKSEIIEVTDKQVAFGKKQKVYHCLCLTFASDNYNCGEGCLLEES